jgi:hypothetical protein
MARRSFGVEHALMSGKAFLDRGAEPHAAVPDAEFGRRRQKLRWTPWDRGGWSAGGASAMLPKAAQDAGWPPVRQTTWPAEAATPSNSQRSGSPWHRVRRDHPQRPRRAAPNASSAGQRRPGRVVCTSLSVEACVRRATRSLCPSKQKAERCEPLEAPGSSHGEHSYIC